MALSITTGQALAWRMGRHLLDPLGTLPKTEVVARLCGVQAQVASSADLAVRLRCRRSQPGAVADALAEGRLLKTWAMRGALHLLTPEAARVFLSLMAAGRSWERPSWQRWFGMTPERMARLRDAVAEALDGRSLTREELGAAVAARKDLAGIGEGLASSWGTLLKPLAWQGDICFGPSRGSRVTFVRTRDALPAWRGTADPEEAAPLAVASYLRAHGPATAETFARWLAGGWFGRRRVDGWFRALGDRLAEVEVDGTCTYALAEDVETLAAARPGRAVRLLGGFDQWVLAPGTASAEVVPPGRRGAVSRQSGWISPVVVAGGRVRGTWTLDGGRLQVAWFREAGRPPRRALESEAARLAAILGRELRPQVEPV